MSARATAPAVEATMRAQEWEARPPVGRDELFETLAHHRDEVAAAELRALFPDNPHRDVRPRRAGAPAGAGDSLPEHPSIPHPEPAGSLLGG